MSGETEASQSGWTTDTLHAHMTTLFDGAWRELALLRDRMQHDFRLQAERMDRQWGEQAQRTQIALDAHEEALRVARETTLREVAIAASTSEKAINAALAAQKEAVTVQAESLRQYDSKQNEWRGSLNDLGKMAMPRSEAEAAIRRAEASIRDIIVQMTGLVTRVEMDTAVKSLRTEMESYRSAAEAARQSDRDRVAELTTRVTQMQAATAGAADKVKGIYAALGIAVTLIIAAIAVINFALK